MIYFREGYPSGVVTGSTADLQAIIDAADSTFYMPIAIALVGGSNTDLAMTGWNGRHDERPQPGSMSLGRRHFARWNSSNKVEQSCAINTLAHEITHTLSIFPEIYVFALTDENRRSQPAGTPSGSYLIGTVAQCTWLQEQRRVPADGLKACVEVFGVRHFNNLRCDHYDDHQPVVVRLVFPAAATD